MDQVLNDPLPWIIASGTLIIVLISLNLLRGNRRTQLTDQSGAVQNVRVVISGAMGNGKTHLWSRLVYGTDRIETVTSMVENRISLDFERKLALDQNERQSSSRSLPICLVDTPGHPRLSCRSLARNFPGAEGIIFVVDSQLGLTGKGLRNTAAALELVLSLLQLLHYQKPDSKLPRLSIHLSNPVPSPTSSPSGRSAIIQKTTANLTKELNRRKISSTGHSNATTGFRKSRLESLDAIPSSEFNSFFDLIKRLFKFNNPVSLGIENTSGPIQLPEEESEVTRLLEEEEDHLAIEEKSMSVLDRYEKLSGHPLHWTVSGQEEEDVVNLIKKWMIES